MNLPLLHVYSRPGCHLCEQLIEALLPLIKQRARIEVLNIDTRPDWKDKYGTRIPVIELDGQALCQFTLDARAVVVALDALAKKQ